MAYYELSGLRLDEVDPNRGTFSGHGEASLRLSSPAPTPPAHDGAVNSSERSSSGTSLSWESNLGTEPISAALFIRLPSVPAGQEGWLEDEAIRRADKRVTLSKG